MRRALEVGFSLTDLFNLDMGFVVDVVIESGNDRQKYDELATQEDINTFFR